MAELLDSITRLQSDPTCMDRLARSSGLQSLAGAQAVYAAAVPLAVDGLIGMVSTASGAKVLQHRAREFRLAQSRPLSDHFMVDESSTDEELTRDVFGSGLTATIQTLAMQHSIDPESARCVLESATGVSLAMALRAVPDSLTLDELTRPILAEQDRFRGSVGGDPGPSNPHEGERGPNSDASKGADRPSVGDIVEGGLRRVSDRLSGLAGVVAAAGLGVLALVAVGLGVLWFSPEDGTPEALPFVDQVSTSQVETVETTIRELALREESEVPPLESSPPEPIDAPDNYAVMSGGQIFLRGFVPSTEVEALIVIAVGEVLGPENVVSEYVVDPDVPFVEGREVQVFIEETVLFETASSEIAPDFFPLLGIGLTLLELQDGVALEVVGHTDSVGDAGYNQRLSQRRVEAVRQFFTSQGIDPERVIVEGRGESDPRADNNTVEGRQANRRVEFLMTGFEFTR